MFLESSETRNGSRLAEHRSGMTPEGAPEASALPMRGEIAVSVVDGLPMPVLVTRITDDTVVRLNPEFTSAYGHTTDAVTDLSGRQLHFVEEDRDRTFELHNSGGIGSVEVRLRSAAGECRWAQADVSRFEMAGEDVLLTTFHDIGDRKQAEALVAEMAHFPAMNPGPVVRLDTDGTIRRSNEAAKALFGPDVEGSCFWEVCPGFPEDARSQAVAGGGLVQEDVPVGDRWFRLTVTHPSDTDQIFVYGTEVTVEKAAEQELAERARFPAMNPGPVARLSAEGTVVRANPAASHLFGMESLAGLSWLDLCPGFDEALWDRIAGGSELVQHEAEVGDRCYSFTLRHEPVANQVFVYGSDITELKAAERALAELARFPDMNPGPVCRLDHQGRVLLANRAAASVFGGDDLPGRSWLDLVPAVDDDTWSHVLSSDEPIAVESKIGERYFVLTHAKGPEGLFVFVYGSDVTREKAAEGALRQTEKMATLGTLAAGVAHELNNPAAAAQRAAEQLESSFAALQTAQMELRGARLSAEVEQVLVELNDKVREAATCPCLLTPLQRSDAEAELEDWLEENGVEDPWDISPVLVEGGESVDDLAALLCRVGTASLGLVVSWQANAHRVYRLLEEIKQGSGRVSEIVGAMKAYSYLGQAPVQSVDVNEGLRNTLVILRSKLKEGVTVKQELAPDLPEIEALGSELNQVWTNLIDNAVDAMEGQGQIRLRTAHSGDSVIVEIEDNGPGIPEETQSRVFDAFFTTKPPGKGTGLGLNTTYKIVADKHAGSIRLDSEPGRTRFTVELPLRFVRQADGEVAV